MATSTRSLRSTLTNTCVLTFRKEEEQKRRREEALIGNVYKEFEEHFDKYFVLFFRKEEEEKRRREEEALIGNVYKEFEEHFDDRPTAKLNKTWVKAGTFNAGKKRGHGLLPSSIAVDPDSLRY